MKNPKSLGLMVLGALTTVVVSQAVLASPTGPPPAANLPNATFNSIAVTPATGVGITVNGAPGIADAAITTNSEYYGIVGTTSGPFAGVRGVGNTGVSGLGVNTGVSGTATAATGAGGNFAGNGFGVTGSVLDTSGTGVAGAGRGSGTGVEGWNDEAIAGAKGVSGRANAASIGTGGTFSGGLYGIVASAITTSAATAGRFVSFDGTKSVNLANNTNAIEATGPVAADKFYSPSNYLTLGKGADYNSADMTGTNYIWPSQPFSNYFSKPITGAYTATNCTEHAGISSGGTCWFPVMVMDDFAIGANISGSQRQTNLLIDWAGNISNPGTYNSGKIPLRDNEGVDIYGPIQNPSGAPLEVTDDIGMGAGKRIYTPIINGGYEDSVTKSIVPQSLTLGGTPDLLLSASGGQIKLYDTLAAVGVGLSNSVSVSDPQGFQMIDPATGIGSLNLTAKGELSDLTGNPVTVRDDQGFTVKNTFATQTLMTLDGSGNLSTKGGIGRVYTRSDTYSSEVAGYSSLNTAYCEDSTHNALSCSFSAGSLVHLDDSYIGSWYCTMYIYNAGATQNVTPKVTCFDPTG